MKVFVAGAGGFIGRNVCDALESEGHTVFRGMRPTEEYLISGIDLLNQDHIERGLREMKPDVIINCAGVVDKNGDFEDNVRISRNLLEAANAAGLRLRRFVMCGSAGEYGSVDPKDWPVSEETPLRGASPYALSKIREEGMVRELSSKFGIDAVVARIFNPIGNGMPKKFLISNILEQVEKIKSGRSRDVTVSRADALRDYIDIKDVAIAFAHIATGNHEHPTYNIGSGKSTSTGELVRCIIEESGIAASTGMMELNAEPELPVASQADVSRLMNEFSWRPGIPLRETIRGVIYHEKNK